MITERINIDVRPGGVPIVVHVTQYEVGLRTFEFVPFTSSGEWTDVNGSATLEGTKPDGNAFQQACTYVDGIVTYVLQEQLCAVHGRVWSRLVIRNIDGDMIGMTAIVWDVGEAGVKDDAVMSESDISALRQFLDEFGDIDAYRGALNGALAAVGGPLVAATASAMTDTTKVYVYTGSESGYTEGHWYYWSGSAWTDGGVYQSTGINTDTTLTVEDMAADAKATGDAVAELKNDLTNVVDANRDIADAVGVVFPYIVEAGGLDHHANSKPTVSTYLPDRRAHTSLNFPLMLKQGTIITPKPYYRFAIMYTTDGGSSYTDSGWKTSAYAIPTDMTAYLMLTSNKGGEPDVLSPETLAESYTITLPDGSKGLVGAVATLTEEYSALASDEEELKEDHNYFKNSIGNPLTQYLNASEWVNNTYWNGSLQRKASNGYQSISVQGLKKGTYHFNRMSAPFTWFEDVETGTIKRASTDFGLSDITSETEVTITFDFNLYLTITGAPVQYSVMVTDGDMPDSYLTTAGVYSFDLTEAFKTSVGKPIYCGSTREYTTLKSAIEEATKYMDSVIYVDAETFDLVEEFGSEWLENYSEEANCGLFLKNRVHVIFASGAKVVFNYTGSNEYIQRRFSPFNAREYGFTLENAYVESTNCRYSVHDERGSQEDAYHNIYKRCTFIHDSTGTAWGSHQAIGGGLGKNGDVLIEDCYLTTAGTATTISYHNSAASDAESKVVLKDSYLSSTSLISNYGTSTKKSRMFVHGCSLKSSPIISTEQGYADNVELIAWNNVIRT